MLYCLQYAVIEEYQPIWAGILVVNYYDPILTPVYSEVLRSGMHVYSISTGE